MTVPPDTHPAELLTLSEAAVATGLSVKALTRRIERGTLPSERHAGRRVVRRGELQRLKLIGPGSRSSQQRGTTTGEVELWRDLYERERQERERSTERAAELQRELVAIANAGPIRAMRLRKQLRARL
jgi:predicted DNA-binding transcriptional regulator AlpA